MVNKIVQWLISTKLLLWSRRCFARFLRKQKIAVLLYHDPKRSKAIDLINKIKKETVIAMSINEAYQLYMATKTTNKIIGDIAEVGVYKGGSAKLICEVKGNKVLHLFDTFEGCPKIDDEIDIQYHKGQYMAPLEDAKNYLNKYKKVNFYKGIFPATAGPIKNKKFSFVHLDVDIYKSTLDCLKFFYPRMNKGGIIISHDYISSIGVGGVRKAFDEFFKDKPEPIIEMSGSQCLVMKL